MMLLKASRLAAAESAAIRPRSKHTQPLPITARVLFDKVALLVIGMIVMIAAHIAGHSVAKRITTSLVRDNNEQRRIVIRVLRQTVYGLFLVVGGLVVLRVLGVELASILAIGGTVAVVIGLSMQGTLSDIASGVLLALFQSYDIGDVVRITGTDVMVDGTIVDFSIMNTIVVHSNTKTMVTVPNRRIKDALVYNYSRLPYYMETFGVRLHNRGNESRLASIISALERDLQDAARYPDIARGPSIPAPRVGVHDMDADNGTTLHISVPLGRDSDQLAARLRIQTVVRQTMVELQAQLASW